MTHPYASETYMNALAGDQPWLRLPAMNTTALLRSIPGTEFVDAAGPYPFAPLSQPQDGADPFAELRAAGAVSAVFVCDALEHNSDWLTTHFDCARPYKQHYLVQRSATAPALSKHHRYEVRRALRSCQVRVIALREHLAEWIALYDTLVHRHGLTGLHAFPAPYFERLATMPELFSVAAFADDALVSCHLWMVHGGHAYSHLAASSEAGYQCGAAYAVNSHSMEALGECEVIDLGGVADGTDTSSEGLRRFKSGFANATATNLICGKILRPDVYATLCEQVEAGKAENSFFPLYRA